MANPFREGGSLNIPTQDAADDLFATESGISLVLVPTKMGKIS
jgi:hypothetical protein